jgi:predicted AAA+ superfamily ATPase
MGDYELDEDSVPQAFKITHVESAPIRGLRCRGCGKTWMPKKQEPKRCPQCNATIAWDDVEFDSTELMQPIEDYSNNDDKNGELGVESSDNSGSDDLESWLEGDDE